MIMKGNGYRKYNIQLLCHMCEREITAIYVPGWGNVLRCSICLANLASRKLVKDADFVYCKASQVIRKGKENGIGDQE
jgi:hypothetical protein